MAYDTYAYDPPRRLHRLRRWVARLVAVAALGVCGFGVYTIAHEATAPGAAEPSSLRPQLERLSASSEGLSVRLETLGSAADVKDARTALKAVRRDHDAALGELRLRAAGAGGVESEELLRNAFDAHADYLKVVAAVLRDPRSRLASDLGARARRVRSAYRALPDAAGVPAAIRGHGRLAAYVVRRGG